MKIHLFEAKLYKIKINMRENILNLQYYIFFKVLRKFYEVYV